MDPYERPRRHRLSLSALIREVMREHPDDPRFLPLGSDRLTGPPADPYRDLGEAASEGRKDCSARRVDGS